MTAARQLAVTVGCDPAVLLLCRTADRIDRVTDALAARVAELLPSHPRFRAAFAIIDPMMSAWHALRRIVARLPAGAPRAARARAALLGPDEIDAVRFSASRVPGPILRRLSVTWRGEG